MTKAEIDSRFAYNKPVGNQPARYEALRAKAKALAWLINELCPDSREKSVAITELESAVMWANASIARNEGECSSTKPIPCCERDYNKDGNCDRHSAGKEIGSGSDAPSEEEAKDIAREEALQSMLSLPAPDLARKLSVGLIDLHISLGNLPHTASGKIIYEKSRELGALATRLSFLVSTGPVPVSRESTDGAQMNRMNRVVAALTQMGINLNPNQLELLWNALK